MRDEISLKDVILKICELKPDQTKIGNVRKCLLHIVYMAGLRCGFKGDAGVGRGDETAFKDQNF